MLSEEEKKAIEYYSNKEVSFSVDFDTEKLLKALGITEEDSFENHQIRFKTLLNLITKLQKENENLIKEKEENKFLIAMANNGMLEYNQGYSDGKNQNSNATEIIIKNRQTYVHKEEVELLQKKIEKYKYLYQKALDNTVKADKENIQLKKQIDLMAEYISNLDIDEDICKEQSDNNCDDINREVECNECIKQYFEKQVKEKGD